MLSGKPTKAIFFKLFILFFNFWAVISFVSTYFLQLRPLNWLFLDVQDLVDPMMVMFEMPEEEQEGVQEDKSFEVTEAIPDVELFDYKTSTRTIHVISGA